MIHASGTVTEIVLPDMKIWNPRQGILFEALEEWFPLTQAQIDDFKK